MFPTRTLALIVALTLSTSVPLTAVANAAPTAQAQPQATYADPCNWVGQDCYSAVTGINLTRELAATLIADRMRSGQSIYEDWTWQGAPEVVSQWHDDLIDRYQSAYGGTYRFPADVTNGRAAAWLAAGASGVDGDEYATDAAELNAAEVALGGNPGDIYATTGN